MQVGNKIYYVNSGREIDTYEITRIDEDNTVHVVCNLGNGYDIRTSFNLIEFINNKLPRLHKTIEAAREYRQQLDIEYEKERQATFDKILEEALNSVTLDTVEQHGILLKSKKSDYESYYSDAPGGTWLEASLYLYEDKQYVIAYRFKEDSQNIVTKECIKFSERK